MKLSRCVVVGLSLAMIALATSCGDGSPTGLPLPPAPNSALAGSASSPTGRLSGSALRDGPMRQLIEPAGGTICITPYCVKPKLTLYGPSYDGRSNYAVAW